MDPDKFEDSISLAIFYCFVSDSNQMVKQLGSQKLVMWELIFNIIFKSMNIHWTK